MQLSGARAALTIATLLMYHQLQLGFFKGLAFMLLALLTLIILILVAKTLQAMARREICVEE